MPRARRGVCVGRLGLWKEGDAYRDDADKAVIGSTNRWTGNLAHTKLVGESGKWSHYITLVARTLPNSNRVADRPHS